MRRLSAGVAAAALLAQPASAQPSPAVTAKSRAVALAAEARDATAAGDAARRQLAILTRAAAADARSVATSNARLASIDAAARIEEQRLATERAPLAHLLAAAERLAHRPTATLLIDPAAIGRAMHLRAVIAAVHANIARRAGSIERRAARIASLRRQALAEQSVLMLRVDQLAIERRQLSLAAEVADETAGDARRRAAGWQERAGELAVGERAAAMQRSAANALAALAIPAWPWPSAPPRTPRPLFRLPAAGSVIAGTGELMPGGVRQRGLLLAVRPGATIRAPAVGSVAYVGRFGGYSGILILDHGHGWTSLLAGLARVDAVPGALIAQGAGVGRAADRLTIEVRHRGRPIDVATLLARVASGVHRNPVP